MRERLTETCDNCGARDYFPELYHLDCEDGCEVVLCDDCRWDETVLEDHEVVGRNVTGASLWVAAPIKAEEVPF